MYAVGRLGSYISRGVYTVSGPFHPFGGAVDIIVVEQQDGSFKSSPWYVRFGKFQGVLKSREKVVTISIDGVEADFHMYLDHKGEAYFLREVDSEEEEEESRLFPLSLGEETDGQSQNDRRTLKANSFNIDVVDSSPANKIDNKAVTRSTSSQSRFLGIFGRKATKEENLNEGDGDSSLVRANSLERAEIAADLLELQWSTNLSTKKKTKGNVSNSSFLGKLDSEVDKDLQASDERSSDQVVETPTVGESVLAYECEVISEISRAVSEACVGDADHDDVANSAVPEISCPNSRVTNILEGCTTPQMDSRKNGVQPSLECEMADTGKTLHLVNGGGEELYIDTETLPRTTSRDSGRQVEGEKIDVDESINYSLQFEPASGDESKKLDGDIASPESSEEEQFIIGDLDDYKLDGAETVAPTSPDHLDDENHHSFSLEGTEAVYESVSTSCKSYSSTDKFVRENPSIDTKNQVGTSRVISIPISIPISPKTPGEQVGQLGESLPNMWFCIDDLDDQISVSLPLSQSLDANPQSLKWTFLSKDDNRLNSDTRSEEQLAKEELNNEDTQTSGELNSSSASHDVGMVSFEGEQNLESESTIAVDRVEHPTEGDPSNPTLDSNGSWKLWPFSFRRSRSGKAKQPALGDARIVDGELVTTSTASTDEKRDEFRPKRFKEMFKAIIPTSEQLAALNLREGRSTITFTFKTGMLGNQQVDASIYLWKWNTRIVISDVDGTITKSDVLGQFMPLVGMDWCQIGVAHLFSAIKENGYQLLFLSARAIAQAYLTRQFLLNIKQDGKALPDGPIVISPDGLFPSLFREVIRRAPHEFKIACLEDIKALFPPDCNPFYAGFGNRDTDEISYRKVGIPKGKIFIINPKGQVAVQRRVDTKSYTNLHDLVHDMFPPKVAEQEDFNSWNFWKLPPPTIDM